MGVEGGHTKTESNLGLNAALCTLVRRLLSEIKRFEKVCVFSFRLLGFMVAFLCSPMSSGEYCEGVRQ